MLFPVWANGSSNRAWLDRVASVRRLRSLKQETTQPAARNGRPAGEVKAEAPNLTGTDYQ